MRNALHAQQASVSRQFPNLGSFLKLASCGLKGYAKGPRTQIIGFEGPNTITFMEFGPKAPIIWVLGPLGLFMEKKFGNYA